LKVLFSIAIILTAFVFLMSTLIAYSDYLDENTFSFLKYFDYGRFTNKYIRLTSIFLLISFIIANANYTLKMNPLNKRKKIQLIIGFAFGFFMILKVLSSYYISLYKYEIITSWSLNHEIKAKNTHLTASRVYSLHGEKIEYFDFNKTKKIYEPLSVEIEMRKNMILFMNDIHQTPTNLTLAFLLMIVSFYLSNLLAERAVRVKHNKNEETNTNPRVD